MKEQWATREKIFSNYNTADFYAKFATKIKNTYYNIFMGKKPSKLATD